MLFSEVILFIYLFIYGCVGSSFLCEGFLQLRQAGPLFIAVRGPLTVAASLVAEHRLQMRRLSSCGSWAQLLCGMWDPPRPGLEPVSPALAGRFSTTAPPGKPLRGNFNLSINICTKRCTIQSKNTQVAITHFKKYPVLQKPPSCPLPVTSPPRLIHKVTYMILNYLCVSLFDIIRIIQYALFVYLTFFAQLFCEISHVFV